MRPQEFDRSLAKKQVTASSLSLMSEFTDLRKLNLSTSRGTQTIVSPRVVAGVHLLVPHLSVRPLGELKCVTKL